MMIRKGLIKRIHVSQVNLRANRKNGNDALPVFTIQTSKGPRYASHVDIDGPSKLVNSPNKPLSCGARIWIETHAEVRYVPV